MTTNDFIKGIIASVYNASIEDSVSLMERPPGRKPTPSLVSLSSWFNGLSNSDRENTTAALRLVAEQSVFSFLAVLDGVRPICDPNKEGILELRYVEQGKSILLNDPAQEHLHDLFKRELS